MIQERSNKQLVLLVLAASAILLITMGVTRPLDFAVFPLRNPGLISIPVGFLLGWVGSVRDRRQPGGADYTETEIRVLTGVGTTGRDS